MGTRFSGLVYSGLGPLLPGVIPGLPNRYGKVFFVDADNGADGGKGEHDSPWATIDRALDACVSGRGDTIVLMPGTYDENVVIDKDYITLVGGMASGYARPDIIPAAGVALVIDNAQGFVAVRCRFASDGQDSDVVRVEGNGFRFIDCVFDGDAAMGNTKALVRLWTDTADDSYTGSEGLIDDCLFRGSGGFGLVLDCQHATVGVLPTDNLVRGCRFVSNDKEDVFLAATAVSVTGIQRNVFERCMFGMGTAKNKATHVDIKTNKIGVALTDCDCAFVECFVNDDTIDTTALKTDACGASWIGCTNLDGVINGDAID